ncbi:hypothetical protein OUZ56_032868 [Daphnia magna]|uniref:Uncharacterized protein n=1 Tax=Daphnia magna TaxID=35525 RepID=A0ABR0B9S3_9CRUS|nr:hypothetical protein OUZ56_032868 [Daphnia magna]
MNTAIAQDFRAVLLLTPVWNLHSGRPILLQSLMSSLESSKNVSRSPDTARNMYEEAKGIFHGCNRDSRLSLERLFEGPNARWLED